MSFWIKPSSSTQSEYSIEIKIIVTDKKKSSKIIESNLSLNQRYNNHLYQVSARCFTTTSQITIEFVQSPFQLSIDGIVLAHNFSPCTRTSRAARSMPHLTRARHASHVQRRISHVERRTSHPRLIASHSHLVGSHTTSHRVPHCVSLSKQSAPFVSLYRWDSKALFAFLFKYATWSSVRVSNLEFTQVFFTIISFVLHAQLFHHPKRTRDGSLVNALLLALSNHDAVFSFHSLMISSFASAFSSSSALVFPSSYVS